MTENIPNGTVMMIDRKTGNYVPFAADYSALERIIRKAGNLLHVRRLALWRERNPIAILVAGQPITFLT